MARLPRKPYILSALCDWAEDNGWTPMIVVQADGEGVQVPQAHVQDGKLTLNISSRAMRERCIDPQGLRGLARFAGEIERLILPLEAIEAFLVRETGEGMLLPSEPHPHELEENHSLQDDQVDEAPASVAPIKRDRGHLKLIK